MSTTKDLLNLANTVNAASIVKSNYNLAKKKKPTTKDFMDTSAANFIGIGFLQANSKLIGGLD